MRRMLLAVIAPVVLGGLAACDNVNEPDPGEPVAISFAPCVGSPDTPTWFAAQDGSGSWTRVTPNASGAFNFTIASGRGGMAMYTPDEGLFVVYASTAELQANTATCGGSVRSVSGTVTGYATLDNVNFQMGTGTGIVFGSTTAPAPFTIQNVEANASDLIAVRYRTAAGSATFEAYPDKVVLRRGVTGSTTPEISFASATEAFTPVQRNLNVTNLAVGEALGLYSYIGMQTTLSNIALYEGSSSFVSGSVTAPFYGLSSGALT
ncbi:MAG TPA: hypothetical protein VFO55_06470, partial [Gemmatimonadaceae bacterium]|nr:hypothetical protein [Gemmatimonadaceae bacterium]